MLDVSATHYVSPLSEVDFTDVVLTVHLVNLADETGLVTGLFRVYNDTTGLLIFSSEIAPLTLAKGQWADVSALTDFSPGAPLNDTYFVLFDGAAVNALVPDGITIHLGAWHFDVKPGPLGEPPEAHAPTHEQAGADPIEPADLGTSELDTTLRLAPDGAGGTVWSATPLPPAAHAATHQLAGGDEIDVAGLSGLLADAQAPLAHHASHEDGGSDVLDVTDLAGLLADAQAPLAHHATHEAAGADRVLPVSAGTASAAAPEPPSDDCDLYYLSALAEAAAFLTPSGTPADGQKLIIRILDNGLARVLSWSADYAERGATLPLITTATKYLYVGLIFNIIEYTWDCISVSQEI